MGTPGYTTFFCGTSFAVFGPNFAFFCVFRKMWYEVDYRWNTVYIYLTFLYLGVPVKSLFCTVTGTWYNINAACHFTILIIEVFTPTCYTCDQSCMYVFKLVQHLEPVLQRVEEWFFNVRWQTHTYSPSSFPSCGEHILRLSIHAYVWLN